MKNKTTINWYKIFGKKGDAHTSGLTRLSLEPNIKCNLVWMLDRLYIGGIKVW